MKDGLGSEYVARFVKDVGFYGFCDHDASGCARRVLLVWDIDVEGIRGCVFIVLREDEWGS